MSADYEENPKVKFGLESQGHIPTVERMLDEFGSATSLHIWQKIGKAIGWDPFTACAYYLEYLRRDKPKPVLVVKIPINMALDEDQRQAFHEHLQKQAKGFLTFIFSNQERPHDLGMEVFNYAHDPEEWDALVKSLHAKRNELNEQHS